MTLHSLSPSISLLPFSSFLSVSVRLVPLPSLPPPPLCSRCVMSSGRTADGYQRAVLDSVMQLLIDVECVASCLRGVDTVTERRRQTSYVHLHTTLPTHTAGIADTCHAYQHVLANSSRSRYVAIATQPVHRSQIRPTVHN